MNIYKLQLGFFVTFIVAALVVNFFVFLPYISVVFMAGVFAIIFWPLHNKILLFLNGRATLAALVSILLVLIFIFTPIIIFGILLFQESSNVYIKITSGNSDLMEMVKTSVNTFENFIRSFVPQFTFDLSARINIDQYAEILLRWLSGHLAIFFSGVFRGVVGFFIMVLALFYFFRDGKRFVASLVELSPLFDVYDGKIINKIKVAINSVIRGQLAISFIQGILTGIGFFIFGVPNPVIWAAVAAVMSLIPTLGTSLVIVPALVFLFLNSSIFSVIGLLVWGICAVGLIDNFLGPILIKRGMQIHPFIILLSVLGGISLFGPIGFVAGPVLLSLLFVLLDLYPVIINSTVTH